MLGNLFQTEAFFRLGQSIGHLRRTWLYGISPPQCLPGRFLYFPIIVAVQNRFQPRH